HIFINTSSIETPHFADSRGGPAPWHISCDRRSMLPYTVRLPWRDGLFVPFTKESFHELGHHQRSVDTDEGQGTAQVGQADRQRPDNDGRHEGPADRQRPATLRLRKGSSREGSR